MTAARIVKPPPRFEVKGPAGLTGSAPAGRHDVKERVRGLRAYAITSVYLYVWLGALLLYKTELLREGSVAALPLGIAGFRCRRVTEPEQTAQ